MATRIKKFLGSGTLFVWFCGTAVATSVLMVSGVLLLIMMNGLGFFWPHALVEMTLTDGTRVLGELNGEEVIPHSATTAFPEGQTRVRLKIGNRDLYGLDFRWVETAHVVSAETPTDVIAVERREWGNFYGRVREVRRGGERVASGNEDGWTALQPLIDHANGLHDDIERLQRDVIGDVNYEIERVRLAIRAVTLERQHDPARIAALEASLQPLERQYREHVDVLRTLSDRLNEYSVVLVETNGRELILPVGQIVNALRPNAMDLFEKIKTYFVNFWAVLSQEPREANTEGGIFPAIFGTVMMVLIMSVAVVPFGVLAAFYLREYARQGLIVRVIRIAVNNLAGVAVDRVRRLWIGVLCLRGRRHP